MPRAQRGGCAAGRHDRLDRVRPHHPRPGADHHRRRQVHRRPPRAHLHAGRGRTCPGMGQLDVHLSPAARPAGRPRGPQPRRPARHPPTSCSSPTPMSVFPVGWDAIRAGSTCGQGRILAGTVTQSNTPFVGYGCPAGSSVHGYVLETGTRFFRVRPRCRSLPARRRCCPGTCFTSSAATTTEMVHVRRGRARVQACGAWLSGAEGDPGGRSWPFEHRFKPPGERGGLRPQCAGAHGGQQPAVRAACTPTRTVRCNCCATTR